MKLIYPVQPPTISQYFNGNGNPTYKQDGLLGHGADDFIGYYGQPIYAACDAYVYSKINEGNPDPSKYRAVCMLVEDGGFIYEIINGHIIDSPVPVHTWVKQGQVIARMGNYGNVWSAGHQVTKEERLAGSQLGTHLHFQIRKCVLVEKKDSKKHYIQDAHGYVKWNDKWIEVVDYDNGYNGCIDPEPFFHTPEVAPTGLHYQFPRDLFFGMKGGDVVALQKFLNSYGYPVATSGVGSKGHETDYFGPFTKSALTKYQTSIGLVPNGMLDVTTRTEINKNPVK